MELDNVDWIPGILFAAVGLALGAGLLFLSRRSRGAADESNVVEPVALRDLEAKRDALLQQIRELDETASKRTPEQVREERHALELEAARVLRALDESHPPPRKKKSDRVQQVEPTPAPHATAARSASPRAGALGFVWGMLTMGALGLLVWWASQRAAPRAGEGPMTGGMAAGAPAPTSRTGDSGTESSLRLAIQSNPNDIDARLRLVQVLLGKRDLMGVWEQTQAVLKQSPGHPAALSYQALVRLEMGQPEMARDMLRQALRTDPNLPDAYLHLSLVLVRMGQVSEAQSIIDEASRRFPDQASLFRRAFDEIKSAAAQGPAEVQTADNPHKSTDAAASATQRADNLRESIDAAPAAPPAATANARDIAGVVDLDASLRGSVPATAVAFIIVREAGVEAGPPAAVKRMAATAFPLSFTLSDSDSMAGEGLPESARVEVRIDSDGNAATKDPADPRAVIDNVKAGTRGLRLVAKR